MNRPYNTGCMFFLVLLLMPLFIQTVGSYQLRNLTLSDLFQNSDAVAYIEIIGSEKISIQDKDSTINCGFDYTIKVITSYKGEITDSVFRSNSRLTTGGEFLIFFNKEYLDGELQFISMGRNDWNSFEKCNSSGRYASRFYGEIFEFDLVAEATTDKKWIKVTTDHIIFPSNFEILKVAPQEDSVSSMYSEISSFLIIPWEFFRLQLIEFSSR